MPDENPDDIVFALLDAWCERRAFLPLRRVLPCWPHNGLSDGIHDLIQAMKGIRLSEHLTEQERERLNVAIGAYSRALYDRSR